MSYNEWDATQEEMEQYFKAGPPECKDEKCQYYNKDFGCMTSGPCVYEPDDDEIQRRAEFSFDEQMEE